MKFADFGPSPGVSLEGLERFEQRNTQQIAGYLFEEVPSCICICVNSAGSCWSLRLDIGDVSNFKIDIITRVTRPYIWEVA